MEFLKTMREWEIESLDETEYVFLEPAVINRHRPGAEKAKANVVHIYAVNEKGYIRASCCGKFNLDTLYPANGELSSEDARDYAAEKGRKVCGRCVASLYSNEDRD